MDTSYDEVHIAAGAGFAGDRISPSVALSQRGGVDGLILECLAERTIATSQRRMRQPGGFGWDPLLDERFTALFALPHLPLIVTNAGAADPLGAARRVRKLAASHGHDIRVAAVTGDDVGAEVSAGLADGGQQLDEIIDSGRLISANAYIGADAIVPALEDGADIVIGGRIADPSLTVAIAAHLQGISLSDTERIAQATLAGHLIECAGQITGGYFADPGFDDVAGLAQLGFPIATLDSDGNVDISKLHGTGGQVSAETVSAQLLYEITDPHTYLTSDVTLDVTCVELADGPGGGIRLTGAKGSPAPEKLKVSVGYDAGHWAQAAISYRGVQAAQRARLARDIVIHRCRADAGRVQADIIDGQQDGHDHSRVFLSTLCESEDRATRFLREVESLGTNGPSGGGGWKMTSSPTVGIISAMIDRDAVTTEVSMDS